MRTLCLLAKLQEQYKNTIANIYLSWNPSYGCHFTVKYREYRNKGSITDRPAAAAVATRPATLVPPSHFLAGGRLFFQRDTINQFSVR